MKLIYTGKVLNIQTYNQQLLAVEGRLALTNNQEDEFAVITATDLTSHDIEHLLMGVGYSLTEERMIAGSYTWDVLLSARHPLFDVSEWESLFSSQEDETLHICTEENVGKEFTITCSLVNRKVLVNLSFN